MKGIICEFECPSCGNILFDEQVLGETKTGKFNFTGPNSCGCGKRNGFKLLTFEPGTVTIVPDKKEVLQ